MLLKPRDFLLLDEWPFARVSFMHALVWICVVTDIDFARVYLDGYVFNWGWEINSTICRRSCDFLSLNGLVPSLG